MLADCHRMTCKPISAPEGCFRKPESSHCPNVNEGRTRTPGQPRTTANLSNDADFFPKRMASLPPCFGMVWGSNTSIFAADHTSGFVTTSKVKASWGKREEAQLQGARLNRHPRRPEAVDRRLQHDPRLLGLFVDDQGSRDAQEAEEGLGHLLVVALHAQRELPLQRSRLQVLCNTSSPKLKVCPAGLKMSPNCGVELLDAARATSVMPMDGRPKEGKT